MRCSPIEVIILKSCIPLGWFFEPDFFDMAYFGILTELKYHDHYVPCQFLLHPLCGYALYSELGQPADQCTGHIRICTLSLGQ